jgi:hypothetical protein
VHVKNKISLACAIALATCGPLSAQAATWDEVSQGDLSNSGSQPSLLMLDPGNNLLRGDFGAPDLDYFTVIVPTGFELSGIVTGIHNNPGLSRSFIGVQAGSSMTVPPTAADATGLLGWTHFSGQDGVNLLPAISVPKAGSTGFTGVLTSGPYTFWLNETSPGPGLTYDLDFQVTAAPVPVPAAAWLLGSAFVALSGLRRRKRSDAG